MFAPSTSEAAASDDHAHPAGPPAPPPLLPVHGEPTTSCRVTVRCGWNAAAGVFYVQDSQVPGLDCEAPTILALMCELPGRVRERLGLAPAAYIDVFVERVVR